MNKWKIASFIIVLAFMVVGCQQTVTPPPTLKISDRSPALDATGISATETLSATFLFQIQANNITKENFLTEYAELASDHTAGNPTITSLVWSSDAKSLSISISDWSNVSTTSAKVVHLVPRSEKIKDVFGNDLYTSIDIWKYTTGPVSPVTPTTSTTTTTTLLKVATPSFVLSAGDYESNTLKVTIECATDWVGIRYTTDESTPTQSSKLYSNPFTIDKSYTVKAIGFKTGYQNSDMASATYNLTWWQEVGGGINNVVSGLAQGSIYAGGSFSDAGGTLVNGMAKWDGSSWSDMGGGGDNTSRAIAVAGNGDVYVGGEFFQVGGSVTVKGIAKWDGSIWSALGGGLASGTVYAIAIDDQDNVYIGGTFLAVDGTTMNRVAKWNGSAWSALGTGANVGVNNGVYSLYYDNASDLLYVGGFFSGAANATIPVNNIAAWNSNTNTWSAVGDGLDSSVMAITGHGSTVYAGGSFQNSGATSINYVAQWNGSSWSQVGSGLDGTVSALVFDGAGTLFAGGTCTEMIQRFDGSSWSSVGGGMVGSGCPSVGELVSDGSNVYAGGGFHTSGGVSTENIAVWGLK